MKARVAGLWGKALSLGRKAREFFRKEGGPRLQSADPYGEVSVPGDAQKKAREALIAAAKEGGVEAVRRSLEHGGDANLRDEEGCTLLQLAAAFGHEETLRLLLEYGAALAAPDAEGWTALMYAADHGHLKICALLLEYGADPQDGALRNAGQTALVLAALRGDIQIFRLLLERTDVTCDWGAGNVLGAAFASGNVALVDLLLERGARLPSPHLDVALHLVLQDRDMRMAQKLRELGARERQPVRQPQNPP